MSGREGILESRAETSHMVAGFNISKECVASVGLELLNPQERTPLVHGEARKQNRADRRAALSVPALAVFYQTPCAARRDRRRGATQASSGDR